MSGVRGPVCLKYESSFRHQINGRPHSTSWMSFDVLSGGPRSGVFLSFIKCMVHVTSPTVLSQATNILLRTATTGKSLSAQVAFSFLGTQATTPQHYSAQTIRGRCYWLVEMSLMWHDNNHAPDSIGAVEIGANSEKQMASGPDIDLKCNLYSPWKRVSEGTFHWGGYQHHMQF